MSREAVDVGVVAPLIDLNGIAAGIRWRRRVWLALALVGLLLGVASAVLLPRPATASARVYVVHAEQSDSGESQMKTSITVLMSSTVANAALQRLNSTERTEDFLASYSAESLAANTLDITASGKSADDAVARVQALADAFIADHIDRANGSATALATAIRQRQDQLRSQVADLDRTSAAGGAAANAVSPTTAGYFFESADRRPRGSGGRRPSWGFHRSQRGRASWMPHTGRAEAS